MTQPGGTRSNNVTPFRRAALAPLGNLAENGGRLGCSSEIRAEPLISKAPCDTPEQNEARAFAAATRLLHASEGIHETLLRQRDTALYIHAWLNGFAFGVLIVSTIALLWWPR